MRARNDVPAPVCGLPDGSQANDENAIIINFGAHLRGAQPEAHEDVRRGGEGREGRGGEGERGDGGKK